MPAEVGEKTPDSTLPSESWEGKISLEDVAGCGPVGLFFYPGDWSSVCTDQLGRMQAEIGQFEEREARVLAISADHRAEERSMEFPLLSDLDRETVDRYGVRHENSHPGRAYFVIDRDGVIRAKKVESTTKDQPELEAVPAGMDEAL